MKVQTYCGFYLCY